MSIRTCQIPLYLLVLTSASCGSLTPLSDGVLTVDGEPVTTADWPLDGCMPADLNEDAVGTGNTCGVTSVVLGNLPDNGSQMLVRGTLKQAIDRDWFWVHAVDLPGDEARGWEDFRLDVEVVDGEGVFEIRVLRGGCEAADDLCDGVGYDSYSWFLEDTEPDDLGDIPVVLQACGGSPYNACADWSGDYYIEVIRVDGNRDCTPYEVRVTNGIWLGR